MRRFSTSGVRSSSKGWLHTWKPVAFCFRKLIFQLP